MTITFNEIQSGAAAFHLQHNATAVCESDKLDVVSEESGNYYLQILMHDYLHFFFNLSVEEEDLLACIESRLDGGCTHLAYLSEYTDKLPAGFLELWLTYKN